MKRQVTFRHEWTYEFDDEQLKSRFPDELAEEIERGEVGWNGYRMDPTERFIHVTVNELIADWGANEDHLGEGLVVLVDSDSDIEWHE